MDMHFFSVCGTVRFRSCALWLTDSDSIYVYLNELSDDPDSYRTAMLADRTRTDDDHGQAADAKPWKYIRVPCLGFFPGLCCPHYDKTQSNGM